MKRTLYIIFLLAFLQGCKKDFLAAKPDSGLKVPSTVADYQALLDYDPTYQRVMNMSPEFGELSSDNIIIYTPFWQSMPLYEQQAYIWAKDIFRGQGAIRDWNIPYQQVFYANAVLDGLANIQPSANDQAAWRLANGSAHFFRALAFFNLAQLFADAYDSSTASTALGLPLKLSADVNKIAPRSALAGTYEQVINDLQQAAQLLPAQVTELRNRPNKPAAYALLSRVYLSMGAYHEAGLYADSSIKLSPQLLDYNTVPLANYNYTPFSATNVEVLFQSCIDLQSQLFNNLSGLSDQLSIDTLLYHSYNDNDLRKSICFYPMSATAINTNGTYSGGDYLYFSGLATDENYLTRAECEAREGSASAALDDLNTLLSNRYKQGTFVPLTASTPAEALQLVLTERRKELFCRGLRWMDLKRLNKAGANITLTHMINGQTYTLPPNSNLYTLPIPPDEITPSGIAQNPR